MLFSVKMTLSFLMLQGQRERTLLIQSIVCGSNEYVLIDTAGMRKKGKVYESTEKY